MGGGHDGHVLEDLTQMTAHVLFGHGDVALPDRIDDLLVLLDQNQTREPLRTQVPDAIHLGFQRLQEVPTRSLPGQGTSFRLVLPLTTAVTQVVMLRFGDRQVAVPSTLVEVVRREKAPVIEAAYASGQFAHDGQQVPFYWLGLGGPELLLVTQAVVVALGAWAIFLIALDKFRETQPTSPLLPWVALVLAVAYLLLPTLQSAVLFDFH